MRSEIAFALVAVVSCTSLKPGGDLRDAGSDLAPEVSSDVVKNDVSDVTVDAPTDAAADVRDASLDAAIDASLDAAIDALDAAIDTPADTRIDTPGADATDVLSDVASEALPDVLIDGGGAPTVRLIAPISAGLMPVGRPAFVFQNTGPATATVWVCRRPACTDADEPHTITSFASDASTTQRAGLTAPLGAGRWWWFVRARHPDGRYEQTAARWLFVRAGGDTAIRESSTVLRLYSDHNNDGVPELLVGEPAAVGAPSGTTGAVTVIQLAGPGAGRWTIAAPSSLDRAFGASVAAAGDVNGDGYGDIVVSAPPLRSYVFYGPLGAGTPRFTELEKRFAADNGHLEVAGLGDNNRDGYADVGMTCSSTEYDRLQNYPGGATGVSSTSPNWWNYLHGSSNSTAGIGDLNGDDRVDLLSGGPDRVSGLGQAYFVYLGATGPEDTFGNLNFATPFARTILYAGDINHDGLADAFLTSPAGPRIFLGSTSIGVTGTEAQLDRHACGGALPALEENAAAWVGDTNGDGFDDAVVARPGRCAMLFGGAARTSTGSVSAAGWADAPPGDTFYASSVGGPGDLNDDGLNDVAVASPPPTSAARGVVYVHFGRRGATPAIGAPDDTRMATNAGASITLGR